MIRVHIEDVGGSVQSRMTVADALRSEDELLRAFAASGADAMEVEKPGLLLRFERGTVRVEAPCK